MVQELKNKRRQLDLLIQLVKPMAQKEITIVDMNMLPRACSLKQFLHIYERKNVAVSDSSINGIKEAIDSVKVITVGVPECERAHTSLLLAKAWMGKLLGVLGEATPYANDGKRSDVKDIEPAADVSEIASHIDGWPEKNHIEKIDWLREEINRFIPIFINWPQTPAKGAEQGTCKGEIYKHLCEARFHLGFELQRIKKAEEKKA